MRIHLATLGCRLNEAELESWANGFRRRGHRITDDPLRADLLILNSCAVTAEAARKSGQWLRRLKRRNPEARLVLSGCFSALEPDRAADLGADLIVANRDKDRLVDIATQRLGLAEARSSAVPAAPHAARARDRQRAFVKVQDGCRYRCTFCAVTLARGEERSRPIEAIVQEIRALRGQGVKEVVLAGVHLGGYGSDIDTTLVELVRAVLAATDLPRLRLGSLEPWELGARFFDLFQSPRLMPHLHLPLQSGSDAVLRRMARRCRAADYASLLERARRAVPALHVSTDVIVGFPGESDDDWQATLRFVEAMQFGQVHVFAYSPRDGTKAAGLPGQVDEAVRKARGQELRRLGARTHELLLRQQLGRRVEVLWEQRRALEDGSSQWLGYSPNWLKVALPANAGEDDRTNTISAVRLASIGADPLRLIGEPVPPPPGSTHGDAPELWPPDL